MLDYADVLHRLREAEAATDAARKVYLAAMAAEAEARAPIKDCPAVLPGSASKDDWPSQKSRWGASDDVGILVGELKTLMARAQERFDHATIYKATLASQVEKQDSPNVVN